MPSNYQPYLAVNYIIPLSGIFPSRQAITYNGPAAKYSGIADGLGDGDTNDGIMSSPSVLGAVRMFAGNFEPYQDAYTAGQIVPISSNTALFSLLGTYYGGNGTTNFALPDLRGRIVVSDHQGAGLTDHVVGEQFGSDTINITQSVLPPSSGGFLPVDNTQSSLTMHYMINAYGIYPSQSGDVSGGIMSGEMDTIGFIALFAGNFTPQDYVECNGSLLSIDENTALYSILGTTYGGDGATTFAVPDLRGRAIVGAGTSNLGYTYYLGEQDGTEGPYITQANMPAQMGGSNLPINNHQPTTALNYIICLQGIFPSRNADVNTADPDEAYLGEIVAFAGNFAPRGWALCQGQTLAINTNTALFSLLGTNYGGNGVTTFNLPDFRGRVAMGADGGTHGVGEAGGSETFTLTMADIPALSFSGSGALYGGNLADNINGGSGNDTITGNNGNDTLNGNDGNDLINAGSGADNLYGGNGNDTLNGNDDGDAIYGGEGDDLIDGGAGADNMTGGNGNDTYYCDVSQDNVIEANGTVGGIDLVFSSHSYTLGNSVENLTLTGNGQVNGTGNGQNNVITGNNAANTLNGLAGNDLLDGGNSNDTMNGGLGDDTYVVGATGDVLTENVGEGIDLVRSSVDWTLGANFENLELTGNAGISGTGNTLDNKLTGNAGNNTLSGLDGNDTIDGGAGDDTMNGGLGNDTYYVDSGNDVVNENAGEGTDIVFASVDYRINSNIDNLTLTGAAVFGTGNGIANTIIGNANNNTLDGKSGNDVLDGGAGTDTMIGGTGNDTYYVSTSTDVCTENANEGTDTVMASVGYALGANLDNLTLIGSGNTTGNGNELNNIIIGNNGNNTLNGKTGNDTLTGGGGSDTFLFAASSGADTVTDFTTADSINVNAYTHGVANNGLITQSGGNVVIDFGGGNIITISNALVADVSAHMIW